MKRRLISLALALILLLGLLVTPVSADYSGAFSSLVSFAKSSGYNSNGVYASGFYLDDEHTVSYEVYYSSKSNLIEIDINYQDTVTIALQLKSSGAKPYEGASVLFDSDGNVVAEGTVSINPASYLSTTRFSSFTGFSGDTNYRANLLSTFNSVFPELLRMTGAVLHDDGWTIKDLGFGSFTCPNGSCVNDDGVVTVQPTCGTAGSITYTCIACGKKTTEAIPATGNHKWDKGVVTVQPTCVNAGKKVYTCSVCKQTKTETVPATGVHKWDKGVTTPPTCVKPGKTVYTCTVCKTTKAETIPATGVHLWDKGTVEQEPTCTQTGLRVYRCATCTNTKTETIPANGHVWKLDEILTPAAETEHGTARYVCSVCGDTKEAALCAAEVFTDVAKPKYAHAAIDWAWLNQITSGTSATKFSPNKTVTRGQVVTFLYRMAGEPEVETSENPFTDVKPKSYCYKAVLWAVGNGITNGTSATTFSPNTECNRGTIVTFLWRYYGQPAPKSSENPFSDVGPTKFYTKAVLWALEKEITKGTTDTTFSPKKTCTRAEAVTFLFRSAKLPLDTETLAAVIAEAESLEQDLYTEQSLAAVLELLGPAKALVEDENATQRQIEEMTAALRTALENLERKPLELEALQAVIEEAEGLDLTLYTPESQEGFAELLAQARALAEDEAATQARIDEMTAALRAAIDALEPIEPDQEP